MHVSGPTRVLTLTHDVKLYQTQGAQWESGNAVEQGLWDISINMPGIGISLVDATPKVWLTNAKFSKMLNLPLGTFVLVYPRHFGAVLQIQHLHLCGSYFRFHANR